MHGLSLPFVPDPNQPTADKPTRTVCVADAARVKANSLRDQAGIRNAVRCQRNALLLKKMGIYHRDGARVLEGYYWAVHGKYRPHLAGVRVPNDLPARPTRALRKADELKRRMWRNLEISELVTYFRRQAEYFGGKASQSDQWAARHSSRGARRPNAMRCQEKRGAHMRSLAATCSPEGIGCGMSSSK